MQKTKKQHYIPQHYLRSFATHKDRAKIWTFDIENRKFFKDSIVNTAHQNYFYAFERDDGTRDTQSFENWLAQKIEGPAIAALDAVRGKRRISIHPMVWDDKEKLTIYINFLLKRVPKFREKSKAIIPDVIEDFRQKIEAGELERVQSEEDRRLVFALLDSYAEEVPAKFLLPSATGLVANAIAAMTWRFHWAPGSTRYITSDNPVYFHEGIGLGHVRAALSLPLSPKVALWATWRKNLFEGHFPASPEMVEEINRRTINNSSRFLYAHEDSVWMEELASKRPLDISWIQ